MSWYTHWFTDDMYIELYAHRDATEARLAIDLFEKVTSLQPETTSALPTPAAPVTGTQSSFTGPLLDLACGSGRHAFELARRGYTVIAADLSPTLLRVAAAKTQRYRHRVGLLRADMRRLPFTRSFSAVLQLFTAFGYFRRDAENEAVINGVRACLPSGAWYMLDFLNAEAVADMIVPYSETQTSSGTVIQERSIRDGRVEKRIHIRENDQEREFTESVRLFTCDDFARMFTRNAFQLAEVYGNYDGAAYETDSPRCLMFAKAI
ncbi:MAG: methyltransferase domain-containing protein [Bacteroidetes bacterium]|nr:methyltransferase domain-containing protein [Bacteroidota bacterium]